MSEFLRNDIQGSLQTGLGQVLQLLRTLDLIPGDDQLNDNARAALEQLNNLAGAERPAVHNEIDNFTFEIPEQTLQGFIATLGNIRPKVGLHYLDRNNLLQMNANPASYAYTNPELAGQRARDAQMANQAAPHDEPALAAAVQAAAAAARNANAAAAAEAPAWNLLQREIAGDTRQEDALLVFTDAQHKQPDWYTVVRNLKHFGEPLGYNNDHYKRCLDRFVGYFAPSLKPVTDDLNATDLAKFLMKMSIPVPKHEKIAHQIENLTRQPNENIRAPMAQLQGLAQAYYSDKPENDRPALINRLMIKGLYSFTTGVTQQELKHSLDRYQMQGKDPDWLTLLEATVNSERNTGPPQNILRFQQINTSSTSLFTTTFSPVDMPVYFQPQPIDYLPLTMNNPYHPPGHHFEPVKPYYPSTQPNPAIRPPPFHPPPPAQPPPLAPIAIQHQPMQNLQNLAANQQQPHPLQNNPLPVPQFIENNLPFADVPNLEQLLANQPQAEAPALPDNFVFDRPVDQPPLAQANYVTPPPLPARNQPPARQGATEQRPQRDAIAVRRRLYNPTTGQDEYYDYYDNNHVALYNSVVMQSPYRRYSVAESKPNPQPNSQNRPSRSPNRNNSNQYSRPDSRDRRPNSQQYRNSGDRRPDSRDRRPDSRDRRSNYQDRRPDSRDRRPDSRNNQNNDRSYDRSRDRRNSYQNPRPNSPYRRDSNQSDYRRSNSNDRRPPYRPSSNYRPNSPSYRPPNNQYNDRRYDRSNSREKSYNRSNNYSSNTRDRSNSPKNYPGMMPGFNCSLDYSPWKIKSCMKCLSREEHHEYQCPTYIRYHTNICPKCNAGYHFAEDCKKPKIRSRSPSNNYPKTKN